MTDDIFIICVAAVFITAIICNHLEVMDSRRQNRKERKES